MEYVVGSFNQAVDDVEDQNYIIDDEEEDEEECNVLQGIADEDSSVGSIYDQGEIELSAEEEGESEDDDDEDAAVDYDDDDNAMISDRYLLDSAT